MKQNVIKEALEELQLMIKQEYPSALFEVSGGEDDEASIHLIAIVDVEDPDVVGDLVIDRVLELQIDKGIPIHVIPIRPLKRIVEDMRGYKLPKIQKFDQSILL